MTNLLTGWTKGLWSWLKSNPDDSPSITDSRPDPTRRMLLAGAASLAVATVMLGSSTDEAEAQYYHGWRRSRRRHHWRRSRRRYHHWRRSRRRYHHWRRSRRRWY